MSFTEKTLLRDLRVSWRRLPELSILWKKLHERVLKSQDSRLAPISTTFKELVAELGQFYEPSSNECKAESTASQVNKITYTSPEGDDDRPHIEFEILGVPFCAR